MRLVFYPHERTDFQRHYLPAVTWSVSVQSQSLCPCTHCTASPNPAVALESAPRVFTDIVSSVFMTTYRTGRVIPSWLVTVTRLGTSSSPTALCFGVWGLGRDPCSLLCWMRDSNPALEQLDHRWAWEGWAGGRPQPQWQQGGGFSLSEASLEELLSLSCWWERRQAWPRPGNITVREGWTAQP